MSIVYYEEHFLDENEAKFPISDRGFQYGDGAFATLQLKDGCALFFDEHLSSLKKQTETLNIKMPEVHLSIIERLIELNGAWQGIWRLKILVTGGDSHEPYLPEREGRVLIFMKPFLPQPFKPLNIGIFPIPYFSCHASFKSLAHLNRFYVMQDAQKQGLDDCITQTESGYILEAAFGNLFWVKEKTFLTPDPILPLYFGVTIRNMIKIAEKLGFTIQYVTLKVQDLPKDAVAFRTNTMQGVRPIAKIANHLFMRNATIEALFLNGYEQLIEAQKKTALQERCFELNRSLDGH